jgi:SNF2 family DNA or RNA helicase
MAEQLKLEFSRYESKRKAKVSPLSLFKDSFTVEIIYKNQNNSQVIAPVGRFTDVENWFSNNLDYVDTDGEKIIIKNIELSKLLWPTGDIGISLDPVCVSIAKAQWAQSLNLSPLVIDKIDRRLIIYSNRWPSALKIEDAPWEAVESLFKENYSFKISNKAKKIVIKKLNKKNHYIADAYLAGSAVYIDTKNPDILESASIPALSYRGEPGLGKYRIPLLGSEHLLDQNIIKCSNQLVKAIKKANSKIKPLNKPENFIRDLYPFQQRDGGHAKRILEINGGVLLAGDMGSGKTTIALALVEDMSLYPLLVIAPISAFSTWHEHLEELSVPHYLAYNSKKIDWDEIASKKYKTIVISYDRVSLFLELLSSLNLKSIIVDEIQRIKNPGSKRSRNIRELATIVPYRIGLSGTPLTNGIKDLLPLGAFLIPNEWSARSGKSDLSEVYPVDPELSISEHLGKIMVRRRMSEVGRKLPKRNDRRIFVNLSHEQMVSLGELHQKNSKDKESGYFSGREGKLHAFARLSLMQKIINSPKSCGIKGVNIKVEAALDLAEDFIQMGRKGVIFTADLSSFSEICEGLKSRNIGYVKINGSIKPNDRILNEKKFKSDDDIKVVVSTIQAGGESWSASPTATWLISTAYLYSPSALAQMEARVYRMNTDPDGPDIEISYIHAVSPSGTLDDRMVEILEKKKILFSKVIDQKDYEDKTLMHYSTNDLLYLILGEKSK